jgi:hypothetical protein
MAGKNSGKKPSLETSSTVPLEMKYEYQLYGSKARQMCDVTRLEAICSGRIPSAPDCN